MGEELGDRLLWRPGAGLEGWTPMREVLENSQRSGSQVSTPSRPSGVHVTDDPSSRGSQQDSLAEGEPTNLRRWRPLFGLPLEACECTKIHDFEIPSILTKLWEALKLHGGLLEEGIFRLAPDAAACNATLQALNHDTDGEAARALHDQADPHVMANLIKVWFRMMPTKLLDVVESEKILACKDGADCMDLLKLFPQKHKGIILWLLEVMSEVSEHGGVNKMTEKAIAIVFAPNLYDAPDPADTSDPMACLVFAQSMAKFLCELLLHFTSVRSRLRSKSSGADPRGSRGSGGDPRASR